MKNINKVVLGLAIGLLTSTSLSAQTANSGFKAGVNFSNLFIDDVDDENMRIGFHAGFFTQLLGPSETIGFQPEIAFSTKGAKGTYNIAGIDGEGKFNLNYIDLPLLAVFKLGEDAEIHAGAYAAYLVKVTLTSEGDLGNTFDEIDRDNFNSFDYGLAGGFALNFDVMSLGIRYNYGLNKIADSDAAETFLGDSKNGVGQIYATFNLK